MNPTEMLEWLNSIGLVFATPNGLPRATTINFGSGNPAGYSSWEAYQKKIVEVLQHYADTDIYKDTVDALASPFCTGESFQTMARARTLLYLINKIGKSHKDLPQTSYTWQWLANRIDIVFHKWQNGDPTLTGRRCPEAWANGDWVVYENYVLESINKYLKKHYPECPRIMKNKYFHSGYGLEGTLMEVHHVVYHNEPSMYREEIQYLPKEKGKRSIEQGYFREYNGKIYTKDNWFRIRTYDKHGNPGEKDIFWPKDKNIICKCNACHELVHQDGIVEVLELETQMCYPCSKLPRRNKPHTTVTVWGDYHSHPWWRFFVRRSHGEWDSLPMGIEIEMMTRRVKDEDTNNAPSFVAWQLYTEQIELNPKWHEFFCERDGSLHDGRGIELVSNPMTLGFAQEYWEKMLPKLREYCVGWNTPKHGDSEHSYGIHLTTSRKYWTDLQLARLIKFIDSKENALFMYCMAQRNYNYGSKKIPIGGGVYKTLSGAVSMVDKKIVGSKERYSSVNIKSKNLVELRIFASTLQQDSFMKNYEFLDSFWNWCKLTPFNIDYKNYLAWVGLQPLAYKRYPHLLKHLLKDHFYFKVGGGKAVKQANIFKEFIKTLPVGQQSLDLEVTGVELTSTIQDQEDIECV